MGELHFGALLVVVALGVGAPLVAALMPGPKVPSVVLELGAGIVVGPALGLITEDEPITVLALVGLAMLLFLAGLELDVRELGGPLLRRAAGAFALTLVAAGAVGVALEAVGIVRSATFLGVAICSTSLGVVVPVLKDARLEQAPFGQLVVLGASVADVAGIVLLALLFSAEAKSVGAQAVLLGGLALLAAVIAVAVVEAARWQRLSLTIGRLQDTTAQIRVRLAFLLLIALVFAAQQLGLEVILGAFVAGALLAAVDPDRTMTHPAFRTKLDAVGFGVVIPVFFVASGLRFDLDALTDDLGTLLHVPIFLAALLIARALPALAYAPVLQGRREVLAAGLLQATSLPFLVTAAAIGRQLELISSANAAALVAAGLVSVLVFPATALALLTRPPEPRTA